MGAGRNGSRRESHCLVTSAARWKSAKIQLNLSPHLHHNLDRAGNNDRGWRQGHLASFRNSLYSCESARWSLGEQPLGIHEALFFFSLGGPWAGAFTHDAQAPGSTPRPSSPLAVAAQRLTWLQAQGRTHTVWRQGCHPRLERRLMGQARGRPSRCGAGIQHTMLRRPVEARRRSYPRKTRGQVRRRSVPPPGRACVQKGPGAPKGPTARQITGSVRDARLCRGREAEKPVRQRTVRTLAG